jgi:hypothetical protein
MSSLQLCPQSVEELELRASEPDRGVVETLDRTDGDLLVAGAGGKMGFHLARMLRRGLDVLGSGRRVIAVSRFGDAAAREPFEAAGIATLAADLCDPSVYDGRVGLLPGRQEVRDRGFARGIEAVQRGNARVGRGTVCRFLDRRPFDGLRVSVRESGNRRIDGGG